MMVLRPHWSLNDVAQRHRESLTVSYRLTSTFSSLARGQGSLFGSISSETLSDATLHPCTSLCMRQKARLYLLPGTVWCGARWCEDGTAKLCMTREGDRHTLKLVCLHRVKDVHTPTSLVLKQEAGSVRLEL